MTWHPLKAFGFIYYEACVNANHQPVGYVFRKSLKEPYTAFYCAGKAVIQQTRGSFVNARKVVTDAAAKGL